MADLKEKAISLLSSTAVADMNAVAVTELYQVPPGKILIPVELIVHSVSATLAGCDDVNFGGGADAASPVWIDANGGLADCTAAGDFYILRADGNENIVIDGDDATAANRVFAMDIVNGADAANGCTLDLFGYLIDS